MIKRVGWVFATAVYASVIFVSPAHGQSCGTHGDISSLAYPLDRVAVRLAYRQPLKIVALGSSSTEGVGASKTALSYPAQLEGMLRLRYGFSGVTIVNKGIGGETAKDMLARLDRDVLAEKPDLVIFQVGANAVLRGVPTDQVERDIVTAVRLMKAAGIDVVLMNSQAAPVVESKPLAPAMRALLDKIGATEGVSVFNRYGLMRRWLEADGLKVEQVVAPDKLHMNDLGYACLAAAMSRAIGDNTNRSLAALLP